MKKINFEAFVPKTSNISENNTEPKRNSGDITVGEVFYAVLEDQRNSATKIKKEIRQYKIQVNICFFGAIIAVISNLIYRIIFIRTTWAMDAAIKSFDTKQQAFKKDYGDDITNIVFSAHPEKYFVKDDSKVLDENTLVLNQLLDEIKKNKDKYKQWWHLALNQFPENIDQIKREMKETSEEKFNRIYQQVIELKNTHGAEKVKIVEEQLSKIKKDWETCENKEDCLDGISKIMNDLLSKTTEVSNNLKNVSISKNEVKLSESKNTILYPLLCDKLEKLNLIKNNKPDQWGEIRKNTQELIITKFNETQIVLKIGSVVYEKVDCIVNAAKSTFAGGGGIDGAIHDTAGNELVKECLKVRDCDSNDEKERTILQEQKASRGLAIITDAYDIKNAKKIIHAVGPIGKKPEELKKAYLDTLELAIKHNIKSIALCCLSAGIYGYDVKDSAPIVLEVIKEFCEKNPGAIEEIRLMMYAENEAEAYLDSFNKFVKSEEIKDEVVLKEENILQTEIIKIDKTINLEKSLIEKNLEEVLSHFDSDWDGWIHVPPRDEIESGKKITKMIGGVGFNGLGKWKIHVSIDPAQMIKALPIIMEVLHGENAPRVGFKIAAKGLLLKQHQIGKELAIIFDKNLEEEEGAKTITSSLNTLWNRLVDAGILPEKGDLLTVESMKRIQNAPEGTQKSEKQNLAAGKFDRAIPSPEGINFFYYREENSVLLTDETYQEALKNRWFDKSSMAYGSQVLEIAKNNPDYAHNPLKKPDPFFNIIIKKDEKKEIGDSNEVDKFTEKLDKVIAENNILNDRADKVIAESKVVLDQNNKMISELVAKFPDIKF